MNTSATKMQLAAAITADPRWAAVVARDARADGTFYYSVKTSGVYCRPLCAAKRARPEHVRFHTSCEEAEQAGFRPCKRCKPGGRTSAERRTALIAQACRLIEAEDHAPALGDLARRLGVSSYYFHRLFKAATGLTPRAYALARRDRRVRDELLHGGSVTHAIFAAGYNSNGRFYERADAALGMTPTAYRTGGDKVNIHFAIGDCSLGAVLVAQSDRGVCAILIGDDPETLARDLQDRFPRANLIGGDAGFEQTIAQVIGFIEAPRLGLDLPLDIRGTLFQQRVWQALRAVPPGTTVSYGELARRIGMPKSVRAVAQACAANVLAVAIPCHRVVRTGGELSGYRWGVERKRALLDKEAGE